MRRWIWILGVVLILIGGGAGENPMEKLKPVQLIFLQYDGKQMVLETDTGDWGTGTTVEEAIRNLESSTAGEILLDTADYLIAEKETLKSLYDLRGIVRPAAELCMGSGDIDPEEAVAYLEVHSPKFTLGQYWAGEIAIPGLKGKEGRYQIETADTDSLPAKTVAIWRSCSARDPTGRWLFLANDRNYGNAGGNPADNSGEEYLYKGKDRMVQSSAMDNHRYGNPG